MFWFLAGQRSGDNELKILLQNDNFGRFDTRFPFLQCASNNTPDENQLTMRWDLPSTKHTRFQNTLDKILHEIKSREDDIDHLQGEISTLMDVIREEGGSDAASHDLINLLSTQGHHRKRIDLLRARENRVKYKLKHMTLIIPRGTPVNFNGWVLFYFCATMPSLEIRANLQSETKYIDFTISQWDKTSKGEDFSVGQTVLAPWGRRMYPAIITSVSKEDMKCDVLFDDHDTKSNISFNLIEPLNPKEFFLDSITNTCQ